MSGDWTDWVLFVIAQLVLVALVIGVMMLRDPRRRLLGAGLATAGLAIIPIALIIDGAIRADYGMIAVSLAPGIGAVFIILHVRGEERVTKQ